MKKLGLLALALVPFLGYSQSVTLDSEWDTQSEINSNRTDVIDVGVTLTGTDHAGGYDLDKQTTRATTVTGAAYGAALPEASTLTVGDVRVFHNDDSTGDDDATVFPEASDNLGEGVGTGIVIESGEYAVFIVLDSTNWKTIHSSHEIIAETLTILEPDAVQGVSDDLILKKFAAEKYPNGVRVEAIHIDASAAYTSETFLFEWWDDASGTTQTTLESIACSAISTEDDGTLSDATGAADEFLNLNFDDTPEDVAYVAITVIYTVL